jgi:hypothetical protein
LRKSPPFTARTQSSVLSKRKTAEMQLQEQAKAERKAARLEALERKAKRQRHMVKPSVVTLTHERNLKRIATKGVLALFNAVNKFQQEKQELAKQAAKGQSSSAAEVAAMQAASKAVGDVESERRSFLDLLRQTAERAAVPAAAEEEDDSIGEL